MRDVLRYAGGAPVLANPNRAQLERIDPAQPKSPRFVEEFKLDAAGLAKPLRDGDVLTLLAISPQFANAVTLKGHVAQPLRYPYTPGHAHPRPDSRPRGADLARLLPAQEPAGAGDRGGRCAARTARDGSRRRRGATAYRRRQAPVNGRATPDRSATSRQHGDSATANGTGNSGAAATRDARTDSAARAGRSATAQRQRREAPTTLFDELNWDYAVIERLNRSDLSTQVIPFNLGKAVLQGDEANNIELLRRRRGHDLQPEGRARAGGAPDPAGVARGRGRRAGRLPAAARRDAAPAADRAPVASRRRPTSTAWSSAARRPASASARTSHAAIARLEALVGHAGGARRGEPARRPDGASGAAVSNAATQAQLVASVAGCSRTAASRSS